MIHISSEQYESLIKLLDYFVNLPCNGKTSQEQHNAKLAQAEQYIKESKDETV